MRAMPAEYVTAIVTDPPYGLSFMGKEWDRGLPGVPFWTEALRVLRPGGHALIFGGTRTFHRLACAVEDAGFEIRDCLSWMYGQGFPKSLDVSKSIKKADVGPAATDDAQRWQGYGTALKPAWEPIILARKPLSGTVAANCQEHGTGALNIDGCRVGPGHENGSGRDGEASAERRYTERGGTNIAAKPGPRGGDPLGRWPANAVLDEEAGAALDVQSGKVAKPKAARTAKKGGNQGALGQFAGSTPDAVGTWPADPGGGPSRFFYCAKASKKDRGDGNTHPTVKPVELMRWLVRLVSGPDPKRDTLILDPFAGSGTTGVAARMEGAPCILIEREAEFVKIIRSRMP
tara:strand:- start:3924 stop:4961 length:1038 start_codon:yes stop_codon:yes gene_type:complete